MLSGPSGPAPGERRLPGWILLLGGLTAIGPLSIDMYLPAFPAMEAGLGGMPGSIGITLATFFVGMTVGQLVYGPVSDRFGRKPPLYFGLAVYLLASLACAMAGSVGEMVLWRLLQALGGCAGVVIARAIVRDRCAPQEAARTFSMLLLVMGLAPILAPLLGGWILLWFDWPAIFLFLAAFGALLLVLVHTRLQESLDPAVVQTLHPGRVLRSYGALLGDREFVASTLGSGLAMAGMFAYVAASPGILIDQFGIAPQRYGWIFGANAFGLIAASQVNIRLLRHMSLNRLFRLSMCVPPLAGLLLLVAVVAGLATPPVVIAGFFLYLAGLGFVLPNGSAMALARQGQRAGTAAALMGASRFLLATLASALMGLWHDGTVLPVATVMCALATLGWLVHRSLAVH